MRPSGILVITLICIVLLIYIISHGADVSTRKLDEAIKSWNKGVRQDLQLDEFAHGNGQSLGYSFRRQSVAIVDASGIGIWVPIGQIANVELVREYGTSGSSHGETRTSRDSQLVGAAVGSALAGPAGFVVGGLSGKTTTRSYSSSTEYLEAIHVKMRLYSNDRPFASIELYEEKDAENFAARIQNSIDCRSSNETVAREEASPFGTFKTRPFPISTERGWWSRTFG